MNPLSSPALKLDLPPSFENLRLPRGQQESVNLLDTQSGLGRIVANLPGLRQLKERKAERAARQLHIRWLCQVSEVRELCNAIGTELLDVLQRGKHVNLSESFRIGIGGFSPARAFELNNWAIANGHKPHWGSEVERNENPGRQNRLPTELEPIFKEVVGQEIFSRLKTSFFDHHGESASFRISRDYQWNAPLPGLDQFLGQVELRRHFFAFVGRETVAYKEFDFNRDFPEKFSLSVSYKFGQGWEAWVQRASREPIARDKIAREIFPQFHSFAEANA